MSKIMWSLYAQARSEMVGKRYSIDQSDAEGFENYAAALRAGKACAVYCDGAKLHACVSADEAAGVAICLVMPMAIGADGELAKREVHGRIRVELV